MEEKLKKLMEKWEARVAAIENEKANLPIEIKLSKTTEQAAIMECVVEVKEILYNIETTK